MTRAYIVTGLGYGDEGKGGTIDWLSRQASTVIVRHNGGPQAGHNVVLSDGRHHTFSQFGAGSLTIPPWVSGAKTFLSRFMLVNPLNMMLEADHLIELGEHDIMSRMFVDENAVVITPFHVAVNRLLEMARKDKRHGSCGQGIGVAAQLADKRPELTLRVKDLTLGKLSERLEALRRHLLSAAPWHTGDPNEQVLADADVAVYLARRYQEWSRMVNIVRSTDLKTMIGDHDQVIFEGAQGVLLDQDWGFHPYTTWSTTTHEHALTLLREVSSVKDELSLPAVPGTLDVVRLGVIRAVTTRHGPGPHPTEDTELSASWAEPHNIDGPWQGAFRVGPLDLMAHNYAVRVCGGVDQVVVTHLDRAPRWRYCDGYEGMVKIPLGRRGDREFQERELTQKLQQVDKVYLNAADEDELLAAIEKALGAPVTIASHGPTAEDKRRIKEESCTTTNTH